MKGHRFHPRGQRLKNFGQLVVPVNSTVWNVAVKVIAMIVGTTGRLSGSCQKHPEDICKECCVELLGASFVGTANILRSVLT
jgi:hypothetical protein